MALEVGWSTVAKWGAGVIASITALYAGLLNRWYNDRLAQVDRKLSEQDKVLTNHSERLSEHETTMATITAHIEHADEHRQDTKDRLARIDEKLDKLIAER